MNTGGGAKIGSNTKLYPKNPGKIITNNPDLTKRATVEKRFLHPDHSKDEPDHNITPKVLRSTPIMSTHRKISTRSVNDDGESDPDAVPSPPAPEAETTQKSDIVDTDEYVTEYYMEEITVTVPPEDDDPDDDPGSKGKDGGNQKGNKGPKVSQKNNGKIYYHMQYVAIPVAIILFCLVAYCLYTVEFPDRKVKFYRVRDHDPILDGPL